MRELDPSLASAIWPIVAADEMIFGPKGFARSPDELTDWLHEQLGHARAPGRLRYRFAIELLDDGTVIGSARIFIEEVLAGLGSIGYALAPPYRGRGYATEAATLALGFAFEQLGLQRVDAAIEPWNEASMRVAAKLGMREGELLAGAIQAGPDDQRDAVMYAITRDEWQAR